MKKVFFAFVAASVVVLSACNNKPAEAETTTVDTVAVVTETTTTTVDTTGTTATTVDTAVAH